MRLTFTPTVLGGDLVRIKVKPEVSSLDFANAIVLDGFRIPALTTRRTETEVELRDGQTFAIAGLLNNTLTNSLSQDSGHRRHPDSRQAVSEQGAPEEPDRARRHDHAGHHQARTDGRRRKGCRSSSSRTSARRRRRLRRPPRTWDRRASPATSPRRAAGRTRRVSRRRSPRVSRRAAAGDEPDGRPPVQQRSNDVTSRPIQSAAPLVRRARARERPPPTKAQQKALEQAREDARKADG